MSTDLESVVIVRATPNALTMAFTANRPSSAICLARPVFFPDDLDGLLQNLCLLRLATQKTDAVGAECRDLLLSLTTPAFVANAVHHRAGGAFAARGLLRKVAELGRRLEACGLNALATAALGDRAMPIDATFFDKHARANWTVPGHQDRIMAVTGTTKRKHRIRDGISRMPSWMRRRWQG